MTVNDILNEIRQGENIDQHAQSSEKTIRRLVAEHGYKLDELVNDPSDEVRAAVARKGYGLRTLSADKSSWVRFAVMETLQKRSKQNAGYDIIARTSVEGKGYALGHNPKTPARYVTWSYDPADGTYCHGHYFTQKNDAMIDFIKRTAGEMNLEKDVLKNGLFTQEDEVTNKDIKKKTLEETILAAKRGCKEPPSTKEIPLER